VKHKTKKATARDLANPDQPVLVYITTDECVQVVERAFDTMKTLLILRGQINESVLNLSPASQAQFHTIADTVRYLLDTEGKTPHPLRQIPELNTRFSAATAAKPN
jgi:hypothetical protein